ncbi:hypothetical protein HDU67_004509 [Dinochytrium kinnereticum]|nr:hypothetical protein HDU67_004509 [Dinochytrium kinnereticum]
MRSVSVLQRVFWEHDSHSIGQPPPRSVLVTGLPLSLPHSELLEFFEGSVKATLEECKEANRSLGIAVIEFGGDNVKAGNLALKAIKKENGASIGGSIVRVEFDPTGEKRRRAVAAARGSKEDGSKVPQKGPPLDIKPFPTPAFLPATPFLAPVNVENLSSSLSKPASASSSPKRQLSSSSLNSELMPHACPSGLVSKKLPSIAIPTLPKLIPPVMS